MNTTSQITYAMVSPCLNFFVIVAFIRMATCTWGKAFLSGYSSGCLVSCLVMDSSDKGTLFSSSSILSCPRRAWMFASLSSIGRSDKIWRKTNLERVIISIKTYQKAGKKMYTLNENSLPEWNSYHTRKINALQKKKSKKN